MVTTTSYLTISNENAFVDGSNFGTVAVRHFDGNIGTGNDGTITFTITPTTDLYSNLSNFGIDSFGFNFSGVTLSESQIATSPGGWSVNIAPPPNQLDGFGRFTVEASGTGNDRRNPLTVVITGITGNLNTYANFHILSTQPGGSGAAYYVAHIAGFNVNGTGSHWVGDAGSLPGVNINSEIPEPASFVLAAIGGLGAVVLKRRRQSTIA